MSLGALRGSLMLKGFNDPFSAASHGGAAQPVVPEGKD